MELTILAAKAQQGDEQAFAEICRRFRGLVKKNMRISLTYGRLVKRQKLKPGWRS